MDTERIFKLLVSVSVIFAIGILILAFLMSCTIPQSELIKDNKLPIECKTLLAMAHLNQKSVDKNSIVPIAQSCKEANRFVRCERYIKDRTLFAECRALLK